MAFFTEVFTFFNALRREVMIFLFSSFLSLKIKTGELHNSCDIIVKAKKYFNVLIHSSSF